MGLRLFVAADMPAEVLSALAKIQTELRPQYPSLRWLATEGMHLTLKFLGGVDQSNLPAIREKTSEIASRNAPSMVSFSRVAAFPGWKRPSVVVAEFIAQGPIEKLHGELQGAYVSWGIEAETRRFRPHITLARTRERRSPPLPVPAIQPAVAGFRVSEIVLYRSHLERSGARYEALGRWPLSA